MFELPQLLDKPLYVVHFPLHMAQVYPTTPQCLSGDYCFHGNCCYDGSPVGGSFSIIWLTQWGLNEYDIIC